MPGVGAPPLASFPPPSTEVAAVGRGLVEVDEFPEAVVELLEDAVELPLYEEDEADADDAEVAVEDAELA